MLKGIPFGRKDLAVNGNGTVAAVVGVGLGALLSYKVLELVLKKQTNGNSHVKPVFLNRDLTATPELDRASKILFDGLKTSRAYVIAENAEKPYLFELSEEKMPNYPFNIAGRN